MSQSLYDRLFAKDLPTAISKIDVKSARQLTGRLFTDYLRFIKGLKPIDFLKATSVTILGSVLLVGCGQKGSLYMPEQANANTDFVIYKPKVGTNQDKDSVHPIVTDKDSDRLVEDEDDY